MRPSLPPIEPLCCTSTPPSLGADDDDAAFRGIIHKHGVSIRVLGDISLVPDYLQRSMATAIHNTRNNTKYVGPRRILLALGFGRLMSRVVCRAVLNVCFSYTARAEMVTAAQTLSAGVQEGLINIECISANPSPRFFP